jgi:hypothetical protein
MNTLSNRYALTRPASIAAKVAALRAAAFPVSSPAEPLIEAPALDAQTAPIEAQDAAQTEPATPFVQLYPHLREVHLRAQRRMFAAIKDADLSMELPVRMRGTNALLGTNLVTSRALSPDELHAVADAIEAGRFSQNWELSAAPAAVDFDDAPFLCEAPPEVEPIETDTTPAPLESLDELAMERDLAAMRCADKKRAMDALLMRREKVVAELVALDSAILFA